MKAPLPEVPLPPARDAPKPPPLSLSLFCLVDTILILGSTLTHPPIPNASPTLGWVSYGITSGLALVLTYFLWRGIGLARVIWLWLTVLSLPFSAPFSTEPASATSNGFQTFATLNTALNLFSLVYLNWPSIKMHFKRRESVELK